MARQLEPEDAAHGGLEGGAEVELVEAHEALGGVHDAVVVVHGHHQAAGEGVAVDEGDRGHGVGEEAREQAVQAVRPEAVDGLRVVEVEPVGVELGDAGRRHQHARRVAELDYVERRQHRLAEGRRQPVVGRRGEGQQVDRRRELAAHDRAAGVVITCRDGNGEEGGHGCDCEDSRSRGLGSFENH